MRMVRRSMALLLVALLLTLTACAKKTDAPPPTSVKLEDVRTQAAQAFDGTLSGTQRRAAADEAMRLLLALLGQPDSTKVADADWADPPRAGMSGLVRHLDVGSGLHIYALALPGNSLVEVRERVALQVRKSGQAPKVMELALLADSKILEAKVLQDGGKVNLTLAMALNNGGGYVAHFQGDKSGSFQPVNGAFGGLAGEYGPVTLSTKDGMLMVALAGEWNPIFDAKQPLRLILAPEVALDWKGKFVLVDDSQYSAFDLLQMAYDPAICSTTGKCPEAIIELARKAPKEAASTAWAQATRKLTTLLSDEKTWADDFTGKLPNGAASLRDQGRDLSVRVLTVPAPEGVTPAAYTAVQFRAGGGIPMSRVLDLPGRVTAFRATTHMGLPALLVAVDETTDPKGTAQKAGLYLYRLNAGNDWVPAEKWVGFMPESQAFHMGQSTDQHVAIQWDRERSPNFTMLLGSGAQPNVALCKYLREDCSNLTWVNGKLHAIDLLKAILEQSKKPTASLGEYSWSANQLALFLAAVDPAEVSGAQTEALLGLPVTDVGFGTRIVSMPPTAGANWATVIHARNQGLAVVAQNNAVSSWEGARILEGGGQKRLVILGRSAKGYVIIVHQWDGERWIPIDALETKVQQDLGSSARLFHTPGETVPVRGMLLYGPQVWAGFTNDGKGVKLCESPGFSCVTYGYNNGWRLQNN